MRCILFYLLSSFFIINHVRSQEVYAIKNVNIISMLDSGVLQNQTIIIRNGKIDRIGAAHPARYLGENGIKGSIKTGKQADLLLLNANPLEDIRNTRKISGLFIKGIYYDQPALEDLKTK
jgi:imidazolonepropionase-like amidohydrolase